MESSEAREINIVTIDWSINLITFSNVNPTVLKQYMKIAVFLTFGAPAYHHGFYISTEFGLVAVTVHLHKHLDIINDILHGLHLGVITNDNSKTKICELVQIKLFIILEDILQFVKTPLVKV